MKDADKPTDGHAAWKYGAYRQGSIQKLSVGDDRWLRAEPPVLFRSRAPGGRIWEAKPPPPFLKAEHFFILNSRFCFQFCTWTCCVCGKVSWSVTLTNAGGEGYVCTLHPPPWICPAYRFFFVVIKYVKHLQSCVILWLSDKPSVKLSSASVSLNKTTPGAFQTNKKTAE